MPEPSVRAPRRRRSPEEAEAEILDAARGLIAERRFHALTVDELMRATTVSRQVVLRVLPQPVRAVDAAVRAAARRAREANALWVHGDRGRAAMRAVMAVLVRDGALVRALHEAARYDYEARRAWDEFHAPAVAAFADRIRRGVASGELAPVEPEATARALLGMNLFQFFDRLVGHPRPTPKRSATPGCACAAS